MAFLTVTQIICIFMNFSLPAIIYLPVLHGEYSEKREKESMAVKQVPTGSIRRLLMEK